VSWRHSQIKDRFHVGGDVDCLLRDLGPEPCGTWAVRLEPRATITVRVNPPDGPAREIGALVRIDTPEELTAFQHGGILPYVLRQLVDKTS